MTFLEVRELDAGYGRAKVLHGVAFDVGAGSISVLLGANGAGKTTVLRALSGMIRSDGQILLEGHNISNWKPEAVVRKGVAHVPQGRGTFDQLSVEDNLRIGAYTRPKYTVAEDIATWFGRFPRLQERRHQLAGSLSGGEQQMLAVARALMLRPRLLLLDEPSLGLAPMITRGLFATLAQINQELNTTMLIVEQNANLALEYATVAHVLEAGQIVTSGSAETIRSDTALRRAYLGY